jgi:hypothetical protein
MSTDPVCGMPVFDRAAAGACIAAMPGATARRLSSQPLPGASSLFLLNHGNRAQADPSTFHAGARLETGEYIRREIASPFRAFCVKWQTRFSNTVLSTKSPQE